MVNHIAGKLVGNRRMKIRISGSLVWRSWVGYDRLVTDLIRKLNITKFRFRQTA